MTGFRNTIINSLSKGAGIIPTPLLRILTRQQLILPFYHTVSDGDLPHIKHLYPVKGVKAFINDLDFLLKHYKAIDYSEFKEIALQNKQPAKPSFFLSFDDGLKEFHDIIAPILIKKGIPAICFLNSEFINNKDLFYRYKASLILEKISTEPKLLSKVSSFCKTPKGVLSINYQNKEVLDEMAKRIDLDVNAFLSTHTPYLNHKQIGSLIDKGFHFGAHSIDHPEYQFIDLNEQVRQTKESMNHIVDTFSLDYKTFSFPFTDHNVSKDFFTEIKKSHTAEITFGCAGQKRDVISNNFQRIPFETDNLSGKQILNAELLYYLMRVPFDKNLIRRD